MAAPVPIPPHASLLFDAAELAIYQQWRLLYAPAPGQLFHIPLPSASEFAEYTAWRASAHASSASLPPVPAHLDPNIPYAQRCHHALHPQTHIPKPAYCPLCTLGQHSALVAALYSAWEGVGGPCRNFPFEDNAARRTYSDVLRAYNAARVGYINATGLLEKQAAGQGDGEAEAEPWAEFSAAAALSRYREPEAQNTALKVQDDEPKPPETPRRKRRVSYDVATPEDTRHTPQACWSRSMPTRDPASPHACPAPEGWEDTSHYNDWEYSISQCRVLLCYYDYNDESEVLQYRDLNAGEDKGMENPHVQRLIELIKKFVAKEKPEIQAHWQRYLSLQSDIWQVWSKGMKDKEEFTLFEKTSQLLGSYVEEWAREIGDIEDEGDGEAAAEEDEEDDESTHEENEEGWENEVSEDDEDDEDFVYPMAMDEEEEHGSGSEMDFETEVGEGK